MHREKAVLRTSRLDLAPVAASDAAALLHVFHDADVRRYLLDGRVVPARWVAAEIQASQRRFGSGSVGLWSVRRRDHRLLIGFVGFREFFEPPELQLLYGLLPAAWGQGLATEAAAAACRFAFDALGWAEIRAATDTPNTASTAVLGRLGFALDRTTDDGEHGTSFYVLVRAQRDPGGDDPAASRSRPWPIGNRSPSATGSRPRIGASPATARTADASARS